ncbi:dihydropteroate synthase [Antricoccus suffuscus]|uniref:Dihydropteroate synthase n=1 Tax=Antricoccus suffuscus TaxID=1629062 RepID=A0A2T0ZXH3_9ACTN|nr:dihydropteroate synthase [Antricoccus suffuscus]PRZ41033.1 dihydropteroate synthase [Antricoccus suffuscus]
MGLRLGARTVADTDLLVMAIVNRTPDSFYDGGETFGLQAAIDKATRAVDEGADIVDIGGVKAGPGEEVTVQMEIDRVGPVVVALRERHPAIVISVDTYRADVAREVIALGCDLVNEAWGGADPQIASVVAETGAALVCSHAGGLPPRTDPDRPQYDDVVADVINTCTSLADKAVAAGVRRDGILIDPCHDFGKNTFHSLEITRRLDELVATGWPVLVALSNKDFVGESLDVGLYDRLPGTLAATVYSAMKGAQVFRAHNVVETRQALDMVSVIRGDRPPKNARRAL